MTLVSDGQNEPLDSLVGRPHFGGGNALCTAKFVSFNITAIITDCLIPPSYTFNAKMYCASAVS